MDAQRPHVQLAGLGRLSQVEPGVPEVVEGPGDHGVVAAVLALHDRQRPLVQLAGLGRLPQVAPRVPEVVEGPGDLGVVGAVRRLGQLEQTLPRWHLCSRLPASVAELGSPLKPGRGRLVGPGDPRPRLSGGVDVTLRVRSKADSSYGFGVRGGRGLLERSGPHSPTWPLRSRANLGDLAVRLDCPPGRLLRAVTQERCSLQSRRAGPLHRCGEVARIGLLRQAQPLPDEFGQPRHWQGTHSSSARPADCDGDDSARDGAVAADRLVRAVAVAISWAGTGTVRPLPMARLSELVRQRLSLSEQPDPRHLATAVEWASAPTLQGAALLRPSAPESPGGTVEAHREIAEICSAWQRPSRAVWAASLAEAAAAADSEAVGRIGFRAHSEGD